LLLILFENILNKFQITGAVTDHVKVVISQRQIAIANLHKIRKNRENYQQNWKKSKLSQSQNPY